MQKGLILLMTTALLFAAGCNKSAEKDATHDDFVYKTEQFADLGILRYQVPGFDKLELQQKKFLYCLQEAALWGREIIYDQNNKHNLFVKRSLEAVYTNFKGDKNSEDYKAFEVYLKRVWFSNGIHHHYANDKFEAEFSKEFLTATLKDIPAEELPLTEGQTKEQLVKKLNTLIFDMSVDKKKIVLTSGADWIKESAVNLYEGVSKAEVEDFYGKMVDAKDPRPVSYGLNSKLVKENGKVKENVYKVGGMYSAAIEKVNYWLAEAAKYTNNEDQKQVIAKLIEFYETGDLKTFDDYSVEWVKNTDVNIDFTNGFIEVYNDPVGYRGAWQSVVYVKDFEMSKKLGVISTSAPWFEKNSPIMAAHKRDKVTGITYNVINAVVESGDCSPSTPIGVNLPNANWIRAEYGSKSVSLGNIEHAYDEASKSGGMLQEFFTPEQQELIKKHGAVAGKLHTGLHEVIGHGSGKLEEGVGTPKETLKNYSSALEEARAELVALYYLADQKLVDLGLTESTDAGKAAYINYIVNGMQKQLVRLKEGALIEQAHMRARSTIAHWCFENGKKENVIERKTIEGKTYFVINDYAKLRELIAELLIEVQRIKSQGDYKAGMNLIENYGVQIDSELHKETLERYKKLNLAAYSGFIQPQMEAVMENGEIKDVKITYPEDFAKQMLFYAEKYTVLPTYN